MNFWFLKKKSAEHPPLDGFIDWHSHILPGVDDGVKSMDETLAILEDYEKLGVKEVWFTPHIMEDIPNSTAFLREKFEEVLDRYKGKTMIRLGSENMLDSLFEERLAADDLLPIGTSGKHLLVETSYFNPPFNLQGIFQRIIEKGYIPLLAHPERYIYMNRKDFVEYSRMGVVFQISLPSLLGYYDKDVRKKAEWLRNHFRGYFIGTDIHSDKMLEWIIRHLDKKRNLLY